MPSTGKAERSVTSSSEADVTDVWTVEGKNPAKRGRAESSSKAIFVIAILFRNISSLIIQAKE
jgi:hypothetical protein